MSDIETLAELNPDALLADGLEAALVGYTVNHHHPHVAVYDIDKCVDVLVERDGMTTDRCFIHTAAPQANCGLSIRVQ